MIALGLFLPSGIAQLLGQVAEAFTL